jgi:tripartite-type tricarboxylate transporter receptor subunit TctC
MTICRRAAIGLPFALAPFAAARAQAWPTRPLRLLVGFAAGGPTDVIARVLAQDLAASLGQPVVVENRVGGNALVATEALMREPADGHSLLMSTLSHSVNAILNPQARYRPLQDFTPVSLVAKLPLILVVGAETPFRSVADLIAAARARPGEVSYGSAGHGGSAHLAGALLATRTETRMTHVPFRGNGPALTEVMAGRVSFIFYPMIGIADLIARGQVRPLAVSTPQRHPDFPDVPTTAEVGLPGFEEYTQGLGILGPARLPEAVVERLAGAIRASLSKPETEQRLRGLGAIVEPSTPAEFARFLEGDLDRWRRVIQAANIRNEE